MPGMIVDAGLILLLAGAIGMALLVWLAISLSKRYGGAVWIIGLVLVPISLMLMGGEIYAAWAILSIVFGLAGGMAIANVIAFNMLFWAHLYTKEWRVEKREPNNSEVPRLRKRGESWWKNEPFTKLMFWSFAAGFFLLCVLRSVIVSSFFIGAVLSIMGGAVSGVIYPLLSLGIGYSWTLALRSCAKADRRFRLYQLHRAEYWPGLLNMPVQESKALEQVIRRAAEADEDPKDCLKKQSEELKKLLAYTQSNHEDAAKVVELHKSSEDLPAGDGELTEEHELVSLLSSTKKKNDTHFE